MSCLICASVSPRGSAIFARLSRFFCEVLDVLVRRHPDDDQLASFVRLADRLDLHARRRRRERAVVLQDVGVVGQLRRRADVVAEHVLRRRDPRHHRQVIDQRAAEVRRRRPLLVRAWRSPRPASASGSRVSVTICCAGSAATASMDANAPSTAVRRMLMFRRCIIGKGTHRSWLRPARHAWAGKESLRARQVTGRSNGGLEDGGRPTYHR